MPTAVRCVLPTALAAACSFAFALGIGCGASSSQPAPCNENPWQCSSGQTCWPAQCTCPAGTSCDPTNCAPQFQCVRSAAKQAGESCQLQIGQATCGDMQTCVELADAGAAGVCRYYCDPSDPTRGCAAGFICEQLTVGNSEATEHVCVPTPSDEDASLGVDAPMSAGDDGPAYVDGLPLQPDVLADGGQYHQ
jgi:hypothetical protein